MKNIGIISDLDNETKVEISINMLKNVTLSFQQNGKGHVNLTETMLKEVNQSINYLKQMAANSEPVGIPKPCEPVGGATWFVNTPKTNEAHTYKPGAVIPKPAEQLRLNIDKKPAERKKVKHYPIPFIMAIIEEWRSGKYRYKSELERKYGITGHSQLQKWIKKYDELTINTKGESK